MAVARVRALLKQHGQGKGAPLYAWQLDDER